MNLMGHSIYVPKKHSNVGISIGDIKPFARPRASENGYEYAMGVPYNHWFWSVVAAWDILDEKAPETPRA